MAKTAREHIDEAENDIESAGRSESAEWATYYALRAQAHAQIAAVLVQIEAQESADRWARTRARMGPS